ncbi:MAG: restriction endonuclease, partial [Hyphomonadaceae bacterium]|nr:restriction endonuclease [Hyphomonadaceae bacterium]
QMLNMTSDAHLFRTREELEEQEGAYPLGGNIFAGPTGNWLPLYVGRMIWHFDHRAASVEVNAANLHHATLSSAVPDDRKADPHFVPTPQYWVPESEVDLPSGLPWTFALRLITNPTNARTMVATIVPKAGFGNNAPLLLPEDVEAYRSCIDRMVANLNSLALDFVARSKMQGTNMNWYIVEQLPVIPPERFDKVRFGPKSAADIVRAAVLELTYTAHDMAPFARDMGHVDDSGNVRPPFVWDSERRLTLRAKLDALFFYLYGITDRDDIRYIYSTFPIIEREETAVHGRYRSRELCLAWMNALAANTPDADIRL